MSTIAGKFKVKNLPIPKDVLDEVARNLNLSDELREKLQGALMVERLPDEEYTVDLWEKGEHRGTVKTKLEHR